MPDGNCSTNGRSSLETQTPALQADRSAQQHITHENTVCILCALVHLLRAQQSVIIREKREVAR